MINKIDLETLRNQRLDILKINDKIVKRLDHINSCIYIAERKNGLEMTKERVKQLERKISSLY
jgi:hypothetical protein